MNKRKNERLPVRVLKSQQSTKKWSHRVVNISETGCAVESNVEMRANDSEFSFDLPLPTKTSSVSLNAKIVWENTELDNAESSVYQYGICFSDMDRVSKLILDAYLDFLRRDVHIARLDVALQKLKSIKEKIDVSIAFEEKKKATVLH